MTVIQNMTMQNSKLCEKKCTKFINKRQRTPMGKSKMDNPEKLATCGAQNEDKQKKNTAQHMLDTTIHKQRK